MEVVSPRSIRPSINLSLPDYLSILAGSRGDCHLFLTFIKQQVGYNLDRSLVHHKDKQLACTHSYLKGIEKGQLFLDLYFSTMQGKVPRDNLQIQTPCRNPPDWVWNQSPSCCIAAVQNICLLWYLDICTFWTICFIFQFFIFLLYFLPFSLQLFCHLPYALALTHLPLITLIYATTGSLSFHSLHSVILGWFYHLSFPQSCLIVCGN